MSRKAHDGFRITGGEAAVSLSNLGAVDITRETNGDVLLLVTLRMDKAPERAGTSAMRSGTGNGWRSTRPQYSSRAVSSCVTGLLPKRLRA